MPVPSVDTYQYDPEKRKLSKTYRNSKLSIDILADPILQVGYCCFLLISGLSLSISRLIPVTLSEPERVAVYAFIFLLALSLLEMPLAWYDSYFIDHKFSLSHQTMTDWMVDFAKALALSFAVILPLTVGLYWLITESSFWWFYAALIYAMLEIIASSLLPFVVVPLFYKLKPLANDTQRDQLLRMARKAGAKNIYRVMLANESARSAKANAFFTGIGRARTMVLFDNLIADFTPREVVTVVAHELGHYVNKDIWREAALGALLTIPELFIANLVLTWATGSFGISSPTDPIGLPLLVATVSVVSFLLTPVSNGISRVVELQADLFSLRMAEDPEAQISTERRLADMNLSDDKPHWLIEILFYTHPPAWKRIKLAEEWKPQELKSMRVKSSG